MKTAFAASSILTRFARTGRALRVALLAGGFIAAVLPAQSATTSLANQPLFTALDIPGNLILALSVEFPTAISVANLGDYSATSEYLGYFDPKKCYAYQADLVTPANSYFKPVGLATAHACSGQWSGNFMNWATMQTIDPYRWALTGGYRSVDTATTTILEKAWGSAQGGNSNFPNRGTDQGTNHKLYVAPSTITPMPASWTKFNLRIWSRGNRMVFTGTGNVNTEPGTHWTGQTDATQTYQVYVRVQVCTNGTGTGGPESNCVAYGTNYKPEGLMQKYAAKIRYSAFSYLNDSNINRDGGVMRARMKFIGPTKPVPGSLPIANTVAEWDAATGVFNNNPDPTDASAVTVTTVTNSGVMNYLNKFGQQSQTYKTYDNVSEMYYAALRYLKNQGNVTEYTNNLNATMVDGFPVITTWDDPILYSCQKNFILGIGDTNTHADGNLPGSTMRGSNPALESAVSADTTVDVTTATNKVGTLEGKGNLGATYAPGGTNNTYYIAGLAYDSHTKDIRPDLSGLQTVSTYWLDVLEYQNYVSKNIYWLAAKYGGFTVPSNYDPYGTTTAPADSTWYTTTDTVGSDKRPDNYYTASRADLMVAGLTKAFKSIVSNLKVYTTSFSTPVAEISGNSTESYSAQYDAATWTGEVTGGTLSFTNLDAPTLTEVWKHSTQLATQLAGTGWDTGRRVATWSGSGVPFRYNQLSDAQKAALDTSYRSGDDGADYLNYLRGDRSHEDVYRARTALLGDIVGSKVRPVGKPDRDLSDAANPGYAAFKAKWAARPTVVYVGANDGMLHAINGALTGTDGGKELFAYVPGMTYLGPNGTPGTDGLAALGNPEFSHRFYVNATPTVTDIDFAKTPGGSGSSDQDSWHSVLIGGMGKGGKGYYAIDATNPVDTAKTPTAMVSSESAVAGNVLWEFTHDKMGYSYGDPILIKTKRYGWVAVLTSGYNNSDGGGYFFIVNPRTGALIGSPIATGAGTASNPSGLAQATGYINNRRDGTSDAVYAGDLLGNLWRLDVSSPTADFTVTKIATLTDALGNAQPITTKPAIAAQPGTLKRFVLVGTGRLLDTSDIASVQIQTFYAIVDGTQSKFRNNGDAPTAVRFPIARTSLKQQTDLTQEVTWNADTQIGWYYELGTGTGSIGWRVSTDPLTSLGQVSFSSTLPNGQVCSPSGSSRLYVIDFGAGKSLLASGNAYVESTSVITDYRLYRVNTSDGPQYRVVSGNDSNAGGSSNGVKSVNNGLRRGLMNWRELPLAD